jgi:lysophospholipase L1-like esterase
MSRRPYFSARITLDPGGSREESVYRSYRASDGLHPHGCVKLMATYQLRVGLTAANVGVIYIDNQRTLDLGRSFTEASKLRLLDTDTIGTRVCDLQPSLTRITEDLSAPEARFLRSLLALMPESSSVGTVVTRLTGGSLEMASSTPSIGQRLLQVMASDSRNANFLVIGDSTSNYASIADTFKWPWLVLANIAARYPKYTVAYDNWNQTFFQAIANTQTGTGTHTLTMHNASWGGVGPRFHLGLNFDRMMFADDFDLIFISHGHNGGAGFSLDNWRDDLLALTESVNARRPGSEIVLVAQNPRPGNDYQEVLQHETQRVAHLRGYGFVNGWRAISDASPNGVAVSEPTAGALIVSDNVHPNAAGQVAWASAFTTKLLLKSGNANSQQPSALQTPVINRLLNGDFASFVTPPTLTSWTATNAVLSKNVTAGQFESGSGYAVKITPSSGAASYISQALASVTEVLSQWMTVSARLYVTSAVKAASTTSGRVSIIESGGSHAGESLSTASIDGDTGFLWVTVSRNIAFNATGLTVRVYGDSGAVAGSVVTVDRVILANGILPRDIR